MSSGENSIFHFESLKLPYPWTAVHFGGDKKMSHVEDENWFLLIIQNILYTLINSYNSKLTKSDYNDFVSL